MNAPEGYEERGYARDASLAAGARLAPLALQLIATPFVIASFGAEAFAVWALFSTTINLMLTADLGVVGIMQRYHGVARGAGDSDLGGRITATVLLALLALGAILTAAGPWIATILLTVVRVAADSAPDAYVFFQNAGTVAVIQLMGLAFSSYLAAHGRFFRVFIASLVPRMLGAAVIATVLVSHGALSMLLIAAYVDAIATVLLGAAFCSRHLFHDVRRPSRGAELSGLWSYAWRNQASALGFIGQREGDLLIAAVLLPASLQATIAATGQLAAAVALAPIVLLSPLFSRLSRIAGRSREGALALATASETTWFALVLPFAVLVVAMGPAFAAAWLGPDLPEVTLVMGLLSAGFVITLANSVRAVAVRALGQPGVETWSYAALIGVKLAVGIPATLAWGVLGLAASTVVASLAAVAVMWGITRSRRIGLRSGHVSVVSLWTSAGLLVAGSAVAVLASEAIADRVAQIAVLGTAGALFAAGAWALLKRAAAR